MKSSFYFIPASQDLRSPVPGMSRYRHAVATLSFLLLLLLALPGHSQTNGTWINTANANWGTATNWAGSVIASGTDAVADFSTLDIAGNRTVTLGATRTVGTIIFQDTTASNDWIIGNTTQTLNLDVTSGKAVINVLNRTLTINAILGGSDGFTKTGGGTLALTNAGNTLTGGIDLQEGILLLSANALGTNLLTTTGASTIRWETGNTQDISAQLKLGDGFQTTLQTNAQNVTFATALQTGPLGTGGFIKAQTGNLTITGVNTFTGQTRVNVGKLILTGGDNRLSAGTNLFVGNGTNAGIIQLGDATGKSDQTVTAIGAGATTGSAIVGGNAANSVLTVNNAALVTYGGLLGGSGLNENNLALTKTGIGTLNLTGTANTFLGDVIVENGTLGITSASSLGAGTKTISLAGAAGPSTLRLNANGIALASSFSLITSNDDAVNAAIVNGTGDNIIGGSLTLATGGGGTGNTRVLVSVGSLTLNGNITAQSGDAATLALILDGAGNGTVNGTIADNGARALAVTKEGGGTWSLTAGNSYTGATTVNGGRLNVITAQTGGGAVTLADGAALGVKLGASGQTLNSAALSLGSVTGASLFFDLEGFANPSVSLITAPSLVTAGTTTVNISGTGLSVGQFGLIDYTGSIDGAGFASFVLGSLPARVSGTLVDNVVDKRVDLNITAFDVPKWTGAVDANWDINDGPDPTTGSGTVNWKESASGLATRYLQFVGVVDSVRFDDSATGSTNVNLTTGLSPNSITVDNTTKDYTFSGSGYLTGTTSIVKQGSGSLTIANSGLNDFTGTTTILGGSIVLGDGITAGVGQLGGGGVVNQAVLILNRPDDFNLANNLSGTGTLIKQGAGIAILSGNNASFDGVIQINEGTVKMGGISALGSGVGNTVIATGAALDLTGFNNVTESIQLNGGTARVTSGTNSRLVGGVTLNGGGVLSAPISNTLTVSGVIGGTGPLTKDDAGTVILTETNIYDGGTVITRGILQVGLTNGTSTTAALGTGDITFNPAAGNVAQLSILRADSITINNKITSAPGSSGNLVIGVAGATSPSQTVTLGNAANDFAGNITINGGALRITSAGVLGSGPKIVRIASNALPALLLDGSGGNLNLSSDIAYQISSDGTGANAAANAGAIVNVAGNNVIEGTISQVNGGGGNGRITVQSGTLLITGNIDAEGATGARTLLLGGAAHGTVSGVISDTNSAATSVVGVTKDGAGVWSLTGDNTYTGVVAVQAGTLIANKIAAPGEDQSLGHGNSAITLGTATTSGTLEYTGTAAVDLARAITVNGIGGGIIKNSGGAVLTLSGIQTKNGRPLTYTGGEFLVSGQVTGANAGSDLIIDNATVTLTNATNNYNGPTFVTGGGVLKNGVINAVSVASAVTLGEAVNNTSGTYDLNGFDASIAGLSSAGTGSSKVTNGAASGIATLSVSGAGTFGGIIQDGGTAQTALAKTTAGVLTLTAANTYTGKTTISGGTLALSGATASIHDSPWVQVDAGATLDVTGVLGGYTQNGSTGTRAFSGSGSIAGNLTIGGSVTLSAGSSSDAANIATAGDGFGTLTIGGDLTLEGGASSLVPRVALQIGEASGNTLDPSIAANLLAFASATSPNIDLINVTGTLQVNSGSVIHVGLNNYAPVFGDVFNLFDWTSVQLNGFNVATDLELPALSNPELSWGTDQFATAGILYVTGVVTAPEPSRALLLVMGLSALFLRRQRRSESSSQ